MSSEEELVRASRAKDDMELRCNDESKASLEAIDRISRSSSSSSLFEPNIDMMVNDFDDELTINEEEAAADFEDPQDEISTLKEEGEMPLLELIAKYHYQPHEMSNGNENDVESDFKNGKDEEEDVDKAESYVKKSIMIGDAYQAIIPAGLSQYGDVLPYENEDKLIWEPSQVSEQEVEEYLLKTGDIKPSPSGEEVILNDDENHQQSSRNTHSNKTNPPDCALSSVEIDKIINKHIRTDSELNGIVKDNEQALHLLVQCGYDFKEALRRKRLNAVPLTGSISLWSEEECKNFEDGIQMFGKDFIKIRQHQVRTRSMRELVHFYYLWKKSERRDHDLANSDTVDHMDIYLNETGDFSSTSMTTTCTPDGTSIPPQFSKKHILFAQNNFSIMTGNTAAVKTNTYRKRRTPVELLTN